MQDRDQWSDHYTVAIETCALPFTLKWHTDHLSLSANTPSIDENIQEFYSLAEGTLPFSIVIGREHRKKTQRSSFNFPSPSFVGCLPNDAHRQFALFNQRYSFLLSFPPIPLPPLLSHRSLSPSSVLLPLPSSSFIVLLFSVGLSTCRPTFDPHPLPSFCFSSSWSSASSAIFLAG